MDISIDVQNDLKLSKLQNQYKELNKKYKNAISVVDGYKQQSEIALALAGQGRKAPAAIVSNPAESSREATVVTGLSDIHIELVVSKAETNGLNKYNPEVAKERLNRYFERVIALTNKERQDIRIDNLLLWLGGDLIENAYLHSESTRKCAMTPTEAALYTDECISAGLELLLEHGNFKSITIPCSTGNHGRARGSKMPHGDLSYKDNHEYSVYCNLARKFSGESRFKFLLPEAYLSYVKVYKTLIGFQHGHRAPANAGALEKFLQRQNIIRPVDHSVLGHFHHLFNGESYTKNGSVIGSTPYSLENAYGHEEPKQFFRLLDNKLGWTISAPIFLEK